MSAPASSALAPMPIIVGSPRSGTTLLRMMLDSHPAMAIPPETGFLLLGKQLSGSGEEGREEFFRAITAHPPEAPGWSDFHLPLEEFRARLMKLWPFSQVEGFRLFYRMYAERFGKTRWGDKTPDYIKHLASLDALLPESRFVHLIRDGRDAAISLRAQWFSPGADITEQARFWRDNVLSAREQSARCRHYLEVRFEDLVRDTEAVLREICSFIELDYCAEMLRFPERAAARLSEHLERRTADGRILVAQEERWRQQLSSREAPDPARIGRWKQVLSEEETQQFEEVAGELLGNLGYEVSSRELPAAAAKRRNTRVGGRRILITNNTLNTRFGAETASRDLALGLAAAGESVVVYTPEPGSVADEIRRGGIPVIDNLAALPFRPEIVHGNQHLEMVEALLACPEARGVFVCHARLGWPAVPPLLDRVLRYVAVDFNCRERLLEQYAIPPERVRANFNSVDLERFRPRAPLPDRPRRALVFSNYATEETHLPAIRRACEELELPLDVIGSGVGRLADAPEDIIGEYDVIFAKARCALEAAAVGAAVVLCDAVGLGPLVTADEVAELRAWNFGMRTLSFPIEPRRIIQQVRRYDAADAQRVSDYIRSHAGLTGMIAEYRSLYDEVMQEAIAPNESELRQYQSATIQRMAALEVELSQLREPFRMEPMTKASAAEVLLEIVDVPDHSTFEQPFWITCRITNHAAQRIGSSPPAPVRLSYHWMDTVGEIAIFEGLRTEIIPLVESGGSEIYQVKIAPPPTPGAYRLAILLVQEGVRWFDEVSPAIVLDRVFEVA